MLYLCSRQADFVSGQSVAVDGGAQVQRHYYPGGLGMFSATARRILIPVLIVFVLAQAYVALVAPSGGWVAQHGFFGAFVAYVVVSAQDPILLAGMIDFLAFAALVAVWMISELPREIRYRPRTWGWLVAFMVYPCLGALLYFLWLNPRGRTTASASPPAVDAAGR